jgi:hypothetical protein
MSAALVLLVAFLCPGNAPGEAAIPSNSAPLVVAQSRAVVRPSGDQLAVARRFEELATEVQGPYTRELMNLFRGGGEEALKWLQLAADNPPLLALDRLAGREPATTGQLQQAYGVYTQAIARLERIQCLSASFPVVSVARREGTIEIDGKLTEPAWRSTAAASILFCFRLPDVRRNPPATCRLLWDDQYLYAGYDIPDTDIVAQRFVRDSTSYLWDGVEIFLLPKPETGAYLELGVTATGGINDQLCLKHTAQWGSILLPTNDVTGLKAAVMCRGTPNDSGDTDKGYSVELAIPFDQVPGLTEAPPAGDILYGLLAISDVTEKRGAAEQDYYSHIPSVMGYQDIWSYGRLKFDPPAGD